MTAKSCVYCGKAQWEIKLMSRSCVRKQHRYKPLRKINTERIKEGVDMRNELLTLMWSIVIVQLAFMIFAATAITLVVIFVVGIPELIDFTVGLIRVSSIAAKFSPG